jgi:hypothetical protein
MGAYCPVCKRDSAPEANFCEYCGRPLRNLSEPRDKQYKVVRLQRRRWPWIVGAVIVLVVVLGVLGAIAGNKSTSTNSPKVIVGGASQSSTTQALNALNPATANPDNAERTCAGKQIPNLIPTDTCANWGETIAGPWGFALDVRADMLHVTKTTRAGIVQACTSVTYNNRSNVSASFDPLNWALEVLPESGPLPEFPSDTYPNAASHITPGEIGHPLPPGGHASGTLCYDLERPPHGRFLLRADAPTPGDEATSVFWETNL